MNDLETWRNDWQSLGETAWAERLGERVEQDDRRLQRALVRKVTAASLAFAILAREIVLDPRPEILTLAVMVLAFTAVNVTHQLLEWLRLGRTQTKGTEAFVDLTRRRLRSALETARLAQRSSLALAVAIVPTFWWTHSRGGFEHLGSTLRSLGIVVASFVLAQVVIQLRKARCGRALAAFERELEDARGE